MGKKEEEQGAKLIRCGMGIVLGGVLALAVCFAFLLAASAAISGGLAGEELMYQLTIVGCVLGAFAGGVLAVRRCGSRALIVGLTAGAVLFLLLLTIGSLCFENVSLEAGGIGLLCGLGLAIASHVMAVPKDEKAEAIEEILPGANCGACGYSGCAG